MTAVEETPKRHVSEIFDERRKLNSELIASFIGELHDAVQPIIDLHNELYGSPVFMEQGRDLDFKNYRGHMIRIAVDRKTMDVSAHFKARSVPFGNIDESLDYAAALKAGRLAIGRVLMPRKVDEPANWTPARMFPPPKRPKPVPAPKAAAK